MPHPLTNSLLHGGFGEIQQALHEIAKSDTATPNPGTKIRALIKFLDGLPKRTHDEIKQHKELLEIEALEILVKAVALCNEEMLLSAHPHLLAQYIPRLTLKDRVAQFGNQIKDLFLLEKTGSLYALREFGFNNSDSSVRLASVHEFLRWYNLNHDITTFQKLTRNLAHMLKDSGPSVRLAAYSALVKLYSNVSDEARHHLLRSMEHEEISEQLVNKIISAIKQSQKEHYDRASHVSAVRSSKGMLLNASSTPMVLTIPAKDMATKFSNADAHILRNKYESSPSVSKRPTSDPGMNSQTVNTTLEIERDPNFAFQKLEPLKITTNNEFVSIAIKAAASYEGKETEHNWSTRLQETKAYRAALRSSKWSPEVIRTAFKYVQRGLSEVLLSLRTVLVNEASLAIKDSAQLLSKQPFFHELFDPVIDSLAKVASGQKKLTASVAHISFCVLLMESPTISNRQFNIVVNESRSLKANARIQAYYCFKIMLVTGQQPNLTTRQSHVEAILLRAISDAAPDGRALGREIYKLLQNLWPDVTMNITPKLTSAALKALTSETFISNSQQKHQLRSQASVQFPISRQPTHQQNQLALQQSLLSLQTSPRKTQNSSKLSYQCQIPTLHLSKPPPKIEGSTFEKFNGSKILLETIKSPEQPKATSSSEKSKWPNNNDLSHSIANLSVDETNMSIEIEPPENLPYSEKTSHKAQITASPARSQSPETPIKTLMKEDKMENNDQDSVQSETAPEPISSASVSAEAHIADPLSAITVRSKLNDDVQINCDSELYFSANSAFPPNPSSLPVSPFKRLDSCDSLKPSESYSMTSTSNNEESLEKSASDTVPLLSVLSSEDASFIESFPNKAYASKAKIKKMVSAVQQLTASTSTLASLAILVRAASLQQHRHGPLDEAVKVWQSCYSIDMNLREYILPFLSHPLMAIETVITALVLLRCLLEVETSYSNAYLDTITCLRHLQIVSTKFQPDNLEVSNLLLEIYDLIVPRGLESCRSVMDLLLNQTNLLFSLQIATKYAHYHSDFANENASGLRSLVAQAASDSDIRIRQHVYPLLSIIHGQDVQVYDIVVSSMSAGQRKFVKYYIEVKSVGS